MKKRNLLASIVLIGAALIGLASCGGDEEGSSSTATSQSVPAASSTTTKPSTSTGTSTAKPSTSTGTSTAKPSTSTGTSTAKPSTSTATSTTKPSSSSVTPTSTSSQTTPATSTTGQVTPTSTTGQVTPTTSSTDPSRPTESSSTEVTKTDITNITFVDSTVTYDGATHTIAITGDLPSGVTVAYTCNDEAFVSATNAGTYTVVATFTDSTGNYNVPEAMTATLTINKADYDMSGVSFNDGSFTYDGEAHSLAITGDLPSGVTVTYSENNTLTNVGSVTVTANFSTSDSNYNAPAAKTATLAITQATGTITVDTTKITKVYGETLTLPTATSNFGEVTCNKSVSDLVNVGTYTVTYTLEGTDNYTSDTKTLEVEITKATYDMSAISFANASFTYDGSEKKIELTGTLPDGVTVSYTNNTGTNVGLYSAVAKFTSTNTNYNTPEDMTASLTISKANYDMSNASWNYSSAFTYDNTEKEVTLTGLPEGVTVASYTNNKATNAGEYTASVTLSYDSANYEAITITDKSWKINKADYDMSGVSFNDGSFTYDGDAHSLAITGDLPSSVTVAYSENNTLTNVGSVTVTANFSTTDSNYNAPEAKTATLAVTKATGTITVDTTKITKVYGEVLTLPTATSNFGEVTCNKSVSDLVNVGTYTVTYTLEGTDNYTGDTKTLEVEITKAKVDKPTADTTVFTYNGSEQTYTLATNTVYTITGNNQTNAGSYDVIVALNDKTNYEWNDNTNTDLSFTFVINKAKVDKPTADTTVFTYNGSEQTYTLATNTVYTITGNIQTNAGSYDVTVALNDKTNYEWSDNTNTDLSFTFVINKATIDMSGVSFNGGLFTYDGNEHSVDVTGNIPDSVAMIYYNNQSLTNVGSVTATAIFVVDSNYFEVSNMTATLTIVDDVRYSYDSENNTATLTKFYSSKESYEVPSSVTYQNVTYTVTRIDDYAFLKCSQLKDLTIPSTVTSIGSYLFAGCSNLKEIVIPSSVTQIDGSALAEWDSIESLTIPFVGNGTTSKTHFGHIFGATKYSENSSHVPSSLKTVIISEGCTSIDSYAFSGCSNIKSITIPSTVTTIGESAFKGCSSLESITLPFVGDKRHTSTDTNQYPFGYIFGESSYTGGTATTQDYYGSSTSSKTSTTYYIPASLKNVTLTNCTYIQYGAFYNCSTLISFTIPSTVTNIEACAFSGCDRLVEVYNFSNLNIVSKQYYSHELTNNAKDIYTSSSDKSKLVTSNGCIYYVNESIKELISPVDFYASTITIDSDCTGINSYAFSGCSNLTSIEIPTSVTSIGYYAFKNCGLTSIEVPTSVTSIAQGAFQGCDSLESIKLPLVGRDTNQEYPFLRYVFGASMYSNYVNDTVPARLKSVEITGGNVGAGAFFEFSTLTSITIPSSVTSIGECAFQGCSNLTSIDIPEGVTSIGDQAFYYCSNLASITIPSTVTSIGESAFLGCSNLTSVTFSGESKLTSIGNFAFYNCSNLTSITLPSGVTSIGDQAFSGCSKLSSITLPSGVTSIGIGAFTACSITSITLPSSITSIGSCAFGSCSKLESITLPFVGGSKTENTHFGYIFGASGYSNNSSNVPSSLKTVIISEGCTSIADSAFYDCNKLTSITIPNSVTSIGASTFSYCSNLASITIPSTVTSVGCLAFSDCIKLTSVTFEGEATIESIGQYAFSGCSSLTSVTIPNSVTTIGEYAFMGCSSLQSITIPFVGESKTTTTNTTFGYIFGTGKYVFSSYDSSYVPSTLKTVVISEGCTSIGEYAFYKCGNITDVTLPSTITKIDLASFAYCNSLNNIYYNGTVDNWCSIEFKSSESNPMNYAKHFYMLDSNNEYYEVTTIDIPNTITKINEYTFDGFNNITSITIPDSVTSIGAYAFDDCSSLTSITMSSNVTSIGDSAFYGCSSLESITLPEGVTSIGDSTFYGCSSLKSITIPKYVTSINQATFYGCSSLESITLPFVGKERYQSTNTYQYPLGYIFGTESYTGGTATEQYYYGSSRTSTTSTTYYIPTSLKSVTITDCTYIQYGAFYNCSNLKNIIVPSTVTSIGAFAFYGCSSLESITLPYIDTYFSYYFGGEDVTDNVSLPSSLKTVVIDYDGWDNGIDIPENAFTGCMNIATIEIKRKVKNIGRYAFEQCQSLTSITLPSTVTSIGESAFADCRILESIIIPSTVTSIGNTAFVGCFKLASVTFEGESTLESIGDQAFRLCSSLKNITIPNSVSTIGKEAFSCCSSLESITLPFVGDKRHTSTDTYQYPFGYILGTESYTGGTATEQYYYGSSTSSTTYTTYYIPTSLKSVTITDCTYIQYGAFYNCSNLTSITIPEGVTSIGAKAFYNCSNLTSITIPEGVTSIGDYAFNVTTGLQNTYYNGTIAKWCNIEFKTKESNPMYNAMHFYMLDENNNYNEITTIDIPSEVTKIKNYAFYCFNNLTSIKLPEGVTSIGNCAFAACIGLTSITLPSTVTSIDQYAFSGCYRLVEVYNLSSSLTITKGSDGNGCVGKFAKDIYTSSSDESKLVTSNGCIYYVNESIKELISPVDLNTTSITIDLDCTSVGEQAFYRCGNLTSVTFEVESKLTSIGSSAFYDCSNLTSITIPEGVTSIGNAAFYNCNNLTSITIPNSVTSIGASTFSYCSNLTSVTLPKNLTSISDSIFENCGSLTSITIPEGVTSIGNAAFNNTTLTSIKIPGSVTSIGDNAFYLCGNLTSVTFEGESKLTSIGEQAFYSCSKLTSITIPEGVTSKGIGQNAFLGCYRLLEVYNLSTSLTINKGSEDNGYVGCYAKDIYTSSNDKSKLVTSNGCIYYVNESIKELIIPVDLNASTFTIDLDCTSIGYEAFYCYENLTSIIIPSTVTSIGYEAFFYCRNLTSITYNGTKEQWDAINKGDRWNSGSGTYTIHCSDGDISK